ncbi:TolC family protein, partial [Kaarinaea lacus]
MELLPSRARGSGMKAAGKWLSFFVLALPSICTAERLTEEQSVQLGLSQLDFVNILESRMEAAQGALVTTKTWSNPELELAREELGEETEINVWLRQRFDISGRRGLSRDAAQADIDSTRAVNDSQRLQRGTVIRQRFFQTLYYQQQQQLFSHWVEKFTTVEAAMRKREEAGDVSGYDRRRISREKVSLLARERHNQANYQAAWQRLLGIIGAKEGHGYDGVQGEIAPDELPPLESVLAAVAQQPELVRLQHQAQSAHLAARAAERGKFPEFTLGIGHKSVDGPALDESGLMLSASVPVPVFDHKQGAALSAESKAREAESQYQLTLNEL